MKCYVFSNWEFYKDFYYSFNKEDLINQIKKDYNEGFDESLDYYISNISVVDLPLYELNGYIITNYNEDEAEFTIRKYISRASDLENINFIEYDLPEIYVVDQFGNVSKEPINIL